jgi:acyl-CoA thioester hydrolase
MTKLPGFDQVMELPVLVEATVTPDHIDVNGHMNIRHYLELDTSSVIVICEDIGIDDTYRTQRWMGVFTAEHHLRYYREMQEGAKLAVHARVLARTDKAAHLMAFLVDGTNERLANTLELVLVHVDLESRRATPMPDDIADGFYRYVQQSAELTWEAPVCGVMGVRR